MPYLNTRKIGRPNKLERQASCREHNRKYNHYYQYPRWKKIRDYYHMLHPICARCAIEGRSVPAEEVHHKIPWSWFDLEEDRLNALIDIDNLTSLCKQCHLKVHNTLIKPDNFEQTDYYKKIHNMI